MSSSRRVSSAVRDGLPRRCRSCSVSARTWLSQRSYVMSAPSTLPTDVPRVIPRLVRPDVSANRKTPTKEMKNDPEDDFCGSAERLQHGSGRQEGGVGGNRKIYPAALHKIKPRYDFRLTSIVRGVYLAASCRPGPGAVPPRALHGQLRPDRRPSSSVLRESAPGLRETRKRASKVWRLRPRH